MMDPEWALSLRDECQVAGDVAFFFKQMGGNRRIGGVWGGDELLGTRYQEFPAYLPPRPGALPLTQMEMFS